MKEYLWLVVVFPFVGALILTVAGGKLSRIACAAVGVGTVTISAVFTVLIGLEFLNSDGASFNQVLWQWMDVSGLSPNMALHLDSFSMTFIFVITVVGALIHFYSVEFMWEDKGLARFFLFMNLFIGFMLILVLADNFLFMYMGWEGVGLCSFLLIGFWYKNPANGYAARKAFIVTRVGDTAMAIGLFILFMTYHTLNIQDILLTAPNTWSVGSGIAVTTAFLLLCGALGKSAQLPFQTWLPDAMAAPSPVSALIHAATMVTAGVYLIARTHVLFDLAPIVETTIAVIGAITLLVAGLSALNQHDIKRVLAYSTISQVGYMFVALGVGAWSASIFHFMIHAFFKALLFLAAGVVIWAMRDEHNMFKMGGLRKKIPVVFWTFLIGASALSALPLITSGFYSKDKILWLAYASDKGSVWLWLVGLAGAFITALYSFRMVFLTFFGKSNSEPAKYPGLWMTLPLILLAFFSFAGGFIELPENMGHVTLFSDFVDMTLPKTAMTTSRRATEFIFQFMAAAAAIAGTVLAFRLYFNKSFPTAEPRRNALQQFFFNGWEFDLVYDKIIIAPIVFLSKIDKKDFIDQFYNGLASFTRVLNFALGLTQNGKVRWYTMVLVVGVIITLTILLYP